MEERRANTSAEEWKDLRRGWYVGDEALKARRIVGEELKRRGWTEARLTQLRRDAAKVRIARRLRSETTVTLRGIAAVLAMRTWSYVANLLSPPALLT